MPGTTPLNAPLQRPLWLRLLLILAIGVLYLAAIRPARGAFMTLTMKAVDVERLTAKGYTCYEEANVRRLFLENGKTKKYQFKAPFDSFFAYSLMFAVFYGIPFSWLRGIALLHSCLWLAAYLAMMVAPTNPTTLNLVDAISYYVNPALTLSVIPLWIFQRKQSGA
jgi:hypothetical protein